jgi:hypothetical protein
MVLTSFTTIGNNLNIIEEVLPHQEIGNRYYWRGSNFIRKHEIDIIEEVQFHRKHEIDIIEEVLLRRKHEIRLILNYNFKFTGYHLFDSLFFLCQYFYYFDEIIINN